MSKKSELITITIAVLTLLVAIGQWMLPKTSSTTANTTPAIQAPITLSNISYPSAMLKVSGMNSIINIKPGSTHYSGGKISSMGALSTIYLPMGQHLEVKVSGMNVTLNIHRSIASFVTINSSGMNTEVNEI